MNEPRHHVAVAAAHLHLCAAIEHKETFTVGMGFNLTDQSQIDDSGTMDALEYAGV